MNSRQRIKTIIAGQKADRCGFWLGNPHADTWPIIHKFFATSTEEEVRLKLGDDFRWIWPGLAQSYYQHPEGKIPFGNIPGKIAHGSKGPFADCTSPAEIESYDWPKIEYMDFTETLEMLKNVGPFYRASGMWTCFYHNVMDLFGMESYMMNMIANPALVHAVTDKVCEFYYNANEKLFTEAGDLIDGFFFGNDFGTQTSLICGPDQFDEFILPWFQKFTDQAHRFGYQVILHSCGSIHNVIERFIKMRVDCLHPLQAKAKDMDAETLARDFKGRIAFMGGIDTQQLLVEATPQEIKADVKRVKELLAPNLIISPSHEAILPNVPPENILAMAQAVL
ncbi:uroporphyrinogen decarboxylase family protein [Planctomycetota bacterium]